LLDRGFGFGHVTVGGAVEQCLDQNTGRSSGVPVRVSCRVATGLVLASPLLAPQRGLTVLAAERSGKLGALPHSPRKSAQVCGVVSGGGVVAFTTLRATN
jgi:hypothetical protein